MGPDKKPQQTALRHFGDGLTRLVPLLEAERTRLADALRLGLVLYDGEHTGPLGDRMFTAPLSFVWG